MASKMVTDRQKVALDVVASVNDNKERVAALLAEELGVPAETAKTFLHAAAERVKVTVAAMIAADHAHQSEMGDDDPPRLARDQASDDLQRQLVGLRDTVTAAYGAAEACALGFDGRMPADPVQLHWLGALVVKKLASWPLPESSRLEGYAFRKEVWTQRLTEPLSRLETALTDVAREKREGEASQVAKNRAIEQCDRAVAFASSFIGAALEAVGEEELAQRVRHSRRRAAQATTPPPPSSPVTEAKPRQPNE